MFTPNRSTTRTPHRRKSGLQQRSLLSGSRLGGTPRNGSLLDMSSQVLLEETDLYVLESFGSELPVVVTEIIYLSESSSDISVRLSPDSDWAWLVQGRRCIIWKYKNVGGGVSYRELSLPPSDLHHNARLVNVFPHANENASPSCIAVSPEGLIRYWSSIAHEGSATEISADLQGQESWLLTDIQPLGSLLGTTTSSLLLIKVSSHSKITCRQLQPPQGFLGGISRRMSSLIWGSMTPGGNTDKLIHVHGTPSSSLESPKTKDVYVLTSHHLQKWRLKEGSEDDEMFYALEVEDMIRNGLIKHVWNRESVNPEWLKVSLLDFQLVDGGIAILAAAVNPQVSESVTLALGILSTGTNAAPMNFRNFYPLQINISERIDQISYRFLYPRSQYLYLHNDKKLLCISGVTEDQNNDVIDLESAGDSILGVGSIGRMPLVFTRNKGLITVTPTELKNASMSLSDSKSILNESKSGSLLFDKTSTNPANLSVSKVGIENLTSSKSTSDQLKGAFLCFCENNLRNALSIVEELFPPGQAQERDINSSTNKAIVQVSRDVIDDYPAMDPRWMESLPPSEQGVERVGASMSMLIKHQLEDKKMALDLFVNFLKKVGLWKRVSGVVVDDNPPMSTHLLLGEHLEKIVAALALRNMNAEFSDVIEKAIKVVLKDRSYNKKAGNLTPQDHFYREVSKVEEIVGGLLEVVKQSISLDQPERMTQTVNSCNRVVLTLIKEAVLYRSNKLDEFLPIGSAKDLEYLPWTSSPGPSGLRASLFSFYQLTLEQVVPLSKGSVERFGFYQQLVEFADIILDGYNTQIESISSKKMADRKEEVEKQYEKDRISLIMPLITNEYYEEAASLAEKYYEFGALVKLCELTNDKERLEKYMDRFSSQNFSDFVFDWHVKEGKQGRLLSQVQKSGNKRQEELGRFLMGHAGFSWIHDVQTNKFKDASLTLKKLALNETEILARKKTMLSLSKLTALASDEHEDVVKPFIDDIEQELTISLAQEQLPKSVLEAFNLPPDSMNVLSPKEIIELYISNENFNADHIDFKKALDLMDYIRDMDNEDKEALKLHIWARSVLRNNWENMDASNPVDCVKETTFFKLAEFCQLEGNEPQGQIVSYDNLLEAMELQSVSRSKNFQFFLQTAYEHLIRSTEAC